MGDGAPKHNDMSREILTIFITNQMAIFVPARISEIIGALKKGNDFLRDFRAINGFQLFPVFL